MPPLIVLRLHPLEPVDGDAFSAYLNGLTIEVFDIGINTVPDGVSIGTAQYVPPPAAPNPLFPFDPDPASDIVQHWGPGEWLPFGEEFLSVATAVIDAPAGPRPEHESLDLRVEITRGAASTIVDRRLYFNVPVDPGPLPGNNRDFPGLGATSLYLGLGDPALDPDPNDAIVTVHEDGTPPRYDDLLGAVNIVLGNDPGGGNPPALADLTPQQARHVAYEIAWNQKIRPLPGVRDRTLEQMYTLPLPDVEDDESDAAARGRFQGDLQARYATGNAEAERLSGFVYALAAAVDAEARSAAAERVGFVLPVRISPGGTGARFKSVRVLLTGRQSDPAVIPQDPNAVPAVLSSPFTVPAAYFYALGAIMPTQVDRDQRYRLATLQDETNLAGALQTAVALRVIVPDNNGDIDGINVAQAARRLRALGAVGGVAPEFPVNDPGVAGTVPAQQARASVRELLAKPPPPPPPPPPPAPPPPPPAVGWLEFKGEDISGFWTSALTAQQLEGHLELVLRALTDGFQPLIDQIKAQFPDTDVLPPQPPATDVGDIDDLAEGAWRTIFGTPVNVGLLPPFTAPGTPDERVTGFIRHVAKFFAVDTAVERPDDPAMGAPPRFGTGDADPLARFVERYEAHHGSPFQFGAPPWVDDHVRAAVDDVFPEAEDADANAWLYETVWAVDELALLAQGVPADVAFSVMEALYARGFTDREMVGPLDLATFRGALVGTVAFEHAATIHANGISAAAPEHPGEEAILPVNPDDCLVNCVPPAHLSPLGPFAYLREMLELRADSTCDGTPEGGEVPTLGEVLAGRRGPLGDLLVTAANAGTRLPLADIGAESLEALAAAPGAAAGAVYQTNEVVLAGHQLDEHDPEVLFAALPEHSTPATPVAAPVAYDNLRVDFSAPGLPYDQPLDVNRTYLAHLRTSRYGTMRRFRDAITEFVLDPTAEPAGFASHLWRYPVRVDTAREYLGISAEEHDRLFSKDLVDVPAPGRLTGRELYGFPTDEIDGVAWTTIVARLPEFLRRTGLTWCEFIELWRSEFVVFGRDAEEPGFPECEPCHLGEYRLEVPEVGDLGRIAVFIRLWRKLRSNPCGGYSFAQLRDVCEVLRLYVTVKI